MFELLQSFAAGPDIPGLYGTVAPPPGSESFQNPIAGVSRLFIFSIQIVLLIGAIVAFIYLLWGAMEWITGSGEAENIQKARDRMIHAVVGLFMIVAVYALFFVIAGDVLRIFRRSNGQWIFRIPKVNDCVNKGSTCTPGGTPCCAGSICNVDTCQSP